MIRKEERNRIVYPIEMQRKARTVLAEEESQMNQIVSLWIAKRLQSYSFNHWITDLTYDKKRWLPH